jgi:N utilization substance protein B
MGKRREGREIAVQFLYQVDLQPADIPVQLANFWVARSPDGPMTPASTRAFAEELIGGILQNRAEIDAKISSLAQNYQLNRIAAVDRNVLRLGVYEILLRREVPPVVVINECLEIAKKFGTEDSSRFVNGILDRVYAEVRATAEKAGASFSPGSAPPTGALPPPAPRPTTPNH